MLAFISMTSLNKQSLQEHYDVYRLVVEHAHDGQSVALPREKNNRQLLLDVDMTCTFAQWIRLPRAYLVWSFCRAIKMYFIMIRKLNTWTRTSSKIKNNCSAYERRTDCGTIARRYVYDMLLSAWNSFDYFPFSHFSFRSWAARWAFFLATLSTFPEMEASKNRLCVTFCKVNFSYFFRCRRRRRRCLVNSVNYLKWNCSLVISIF